MTVALAAAAVLGAAWIWRRFRLRRAATMLWRQVHWSLKRAPRDRLVLDVGAGDNPHLRADVLCERYLQDDVHRSGAPAREGPVVVGDAAALPFKTAAFDCIVARALIEHLEDPAAFFAEAARVAHAGLFVAPSALWERCFSMSTHRWMVKKGDEGLCLTAKPAAVLNPEIADFFATQVFRDRSRLDDFVLEHWDALRVTYEWEGEPRWVLESPGAESPPGFVVGSDGEGAVQRRARGREALRRRAKLGVRRLMHALLSAHHTVDLERILACPGCRGDVVLDATEVGCRGCGARYPVEDGVPIMLLERARCPAARA